MIDSCQSFRRTCLQYRKIAKHTFVPDHFESAQRGMMECIEKERVQQEIKKQIFYI